MNGNDSALSPPPHKRRAGLKHRETTHVHKGDSKEGAGTEDHESDSDFEKIGFDLPPDSSSSGSDVSDGESSAPNSVNSTPRRAGRKSSCLGLPDRVSDKEQTPTPTQETLLDKERKAVEEIFLEGSYKYTMRKDYYAINRAWWNHWSSYTGYHGAQGLSFEQRLLSAEPPGPIDNTSLVVPNATLTDAYTRFGELIEEADTGPSPEVLAKFPPKVPVGSSYAVVPAEVWGFLRETYGGGPEVCVQHAGPIIGRRCKFEALRLGVEHSLHPGRTFSVECYNYWTGRYLKHVLMTVFRLGGTPEGNVRLVDVSYRGRRAVLRDDMTLVLNKIVSGNSLLFEVKDAATNEWPALCQEQQQHQQSTKQMESGVNKGSICAGTNSSDGLCPQQQQLLTEKPCGTRGIGLCGLVNMGNTCYMNCVLQCLSHTSPLTRYFLETDWQCDPRLHGRVGALAGEYYNVLERLWESSAADEMRAFEPRAFRSCVAALAPRFSGLQQQDCHDVLSIILDGLSDDLNCASSAGAAELTSLEYNGEPAEEWARTEWEREARQRWSVVTALFAGQLLSTRECPDCGGRTLSCHQFHTLELPIPAGPARRQQVVRVYFSASERLRHLGLYLTLSFTVGTGCTIASLRRRTAEALSSIGGPLGQDHFDERCILVAHIAQGGRAVLDTDLEAPVCPHSEYAACVVDSPADLSLHCLVQVRMCEAHSGLMGARYFYGNSSGSMSGNGNGSNCGGGVLSQCFLWLPASSATYARVTVEVVRVFACLSPQKHAEAERKLAALAEFKVRRSPQSSPAEKKRWDPAKGEDLGAPVFEKLSNAAVAECADSLFELQENAPIQRRWQRGGAAGNAAVVALNAVATAKWKPLCTPRPEECAQFNADEGSATAATGGHGICLGDCLAACGRPEQLSEGNGWRCPRCEAEKKAVVTLGVWRAPPVLIIDLMRFGVQSLYASSKVETRVEFPLEGLDMTPYVRGPPPPEGLCYDLYAVCNHIGSPSYGHYTAYAKCGSGWYLFDDAQVKRVDEPAAATIVSSEAYLLFYVRRGFSLPKEFFFS